MGSVVSTPPPPPPQFWANPWRDINWRSKAELHTYVRNYRPPDRASHVHILLYGGTGAGKSSFINSAGSAILRRSVFVAEPSNSGAGTSFTVQYRTHKFRMRGENVRIPIVFSEILGLEGSDHGVLPEDIILALKGHVKDGYFFNPLHGLSPEDRHYNPSPSIDDKVHVLALVLDGSPAEIDRSVLEKMKKIRKAARDLGIPQVMIVTHIDKVCKEIEEDVTTVFRSRLLKKKIDEISADVGILVNYMFPVWNNYEGEKKDVVDTLILAALKQLLDYGDDFFDATEQTEG